MPTHDQVAAKWAQTVGTEQWTGRGLTGARMFGESDALYSHGHHFRLAEVHTRDDGSRWFMLNGDNYSVSTSRHQSITRGAVHATGADSMIVPFTALQRGGIIRQTITPVEVLPESHEWIKHSAADWADVPEAQHYYATRNREDRTYYHSEEPVPQDGRWHWETGRHWLGGAVFSADYVIYDHGSELPYGTRGRAYFISGFDENERRPQYFLAQLPDGAQPQSYAAALDALQPDAVRMAAAAGRTVLRQGDVFAIECPTADARQLRSLGAERARMAYVLGVNHIATEVATVSDLTYARGILRHRPREIWREAEHRNVKLGDGKTWHHLVKNTVPAGRSWSLGGRVD